MRRADSAGSGQDTFLSQLDVVERVIGFVCARHHLAAPDADDFSSHAKLRLIEDDYAIIRKFEGRSSLRTYLTIVIQRLFLDYRVSAWGKWRPSAEAKRAGAVAVLLEQLTGRDGYAFGEACELLKTNHQVGLAQSELEAIAARLPVRARRHFESDEALADMAAAQQPPDEVAAADDRAAAAARVERALKAAMAPLDAQDRLVLAMRFEDGRTVAEIAGVLRLDQKGLYRRLERLLKDLRNALQSQGIDATAVLEILDGPAVSIGWRDDTGQESAAQRPSMSKGAQEWR